MMLTNTASVQQTDIQLYLFKSSDWKEKLEVTVVLLDGMRKVVVTDNQSEAAVWFRTAQAMF